MSYASVMGEMQTIQARLVQAGILQAATPAKAATSKAAAASFATALTDASATAATIGAAPTTAPTTAVASTTATAATAATDGTAVDANGVTGDDVVEAALTYKGTPYVLGGESKSGIDCSGLVQAAFAKLGVAVPRLVHEQQTVGQKVDSLKDAKPGDLIVLNGGDHIAIYMGNDTVIHAPYAGRTVSVQKAWFDDSDITSIRRIVPATDAGTTPSQSGTAATDSAVTNGNGLSLATVARATALLGMFGADAGMSSTSSDGSSSSDSSSSLSSLLSSFGITGSSSTDSSSSLLSSLGLSGTTSSTSTTSAATQQVLAARAAMYGTSA